MAKIKVTKVKSTIEKDERQKRTMAALGLNKIGSSNIVEKQCCCGWHDREGEPSESQWRTLNQEH
jgi:hypothetical protein